MALDKMPRRREPQGGSARTHAGVRWKGWGRAPGPAGAALTLPITMITYHHSSAQRSRMVRASLLRINQISRERGEGSERNSACTARRHTGGVSVLPIGNNLVIAILGIGFSNFEPCEKCTCGCGVVAAPVARPTRRARSCVFGARPPSPGDLIGVYATI